MSICAKIVFLQNCPDVKNEVFEEEITFIAFVFSMLDTEKQRKNGKRPKKPLRIVFKGGHPKMRKLKKMDFFAEIA